MIIGRLIIDDWTTTAGEESSKDISVARNILKQVQILSSPDLLLNKQGSKMKLKERIEVAQKNMEERDDPKTTD